MRYLYEPYQKFGGNGLAEKIMQDVQSLPIHGGERRTTIQFMKENHVGSSDL